MVDCWHVARRLVPRAGIAVLLTLAPRALANEAREPRFADLAALIEGGNAKSIEELLAALPASYRSHYALLFRSRSLHEASYENPRALVYGDSAKLIVSFNGSPDQRGYQALEVMEFDDATAAFRFREVIFPAGDAVAKGRGGATISAVNPPKCLKCHGSPAHPVWDTFPTWPGAFGERYRRPLAPEELAGLERFRQRQPVHPRYRSLESFDRFSSQGLLAGDVRRGVTYNGLVQVPPNAELGGLLGRMNLRAIAQQVTSAPRFPAFAPVLVAALAGDCPSLESYFPEGVTGEFFADFERFAASVAAADRQQAARKELRALQRTSEEGDAAVTNPMFLYLVERGLGLSTAAWSTALERGTYDFASLDTGLAGLAQLLESQAEGTRAAKALRQSPERYCERLRHLSLTALAGVTTFAPVTVMNAKAAEAAASSVRQRPALVDLCIGCHETAAAPAIPFSDTKRLAAAFRTGHYPHGTLWDEVAYRLSPGAGADQMPRGLNISDTERDSLMNYFQGILTEK